MENNLTAKASVKINALDSKVWKGLTDPQIIKKYMMDATVESDWKKGSKIIWKGEIKGKSTRTKEKFWI